MAWKYLGGGFIPGVPPYDMTDAEFDAASDELDKQYPDQPGSLKRSALYKHIKDGPPETVAPETVAPKAAAPKED